MGQAEAGASSPDEQTPAGGSPRVYLELARNADFRNLGLSSLASALGDWIGFLAILALTADILGQTRAAAFAVSAVMAARVLPSMLLGPVAGVFVDRWDRKRLMIACDIGRGIVMALIPFSDEILTLLLATLVIEVMSSLFGPAKDAVFPTLVRRDQLVVANQLNLMVTYGTLPVAGVVFAATVGLAGPLSGVIPFLAERPVALPIWLNAASFILSAPLIARIRGGETGRRVLADAHQPSAWDELREGFHFIGTHPLIRALILGVMVAFAAAGAVISVGQFFAQVLNAGQSGFGILVAAVGSGLVGGLIASAWLSAKLAPERLFAPGIGIAGGALIVTALAPALRYAIPPAVVMGAAAGVAFIVGYTILQSRADDRIRGRTFGAFNSGVRASIFLSTTTAPLLVGIIGSEPRELIVRPDGPPEFVYAYAIGGVRLSLILAGLLAVAGAIFSGRAFHKALTTQTQLDLAGSLTRHPERAAGLFVVFEGGDGSGKSTQIRLLRAAIERTGHPVLVTREPGGTRVGEAIREILLTTEGEPISDRTEALLYAAARAEHVRDVIGPALETGSVVLSDRYVDSSVVYQGAARGLGEDHVAELNRWATEDLVPDLVVLLDVDPVEGLRRVGEHPDRLEAAGLPFHRAVAAGYRRQAEADPDRYLVLDAGRPVEDLHTEVRDAVLARIRARTEPEVSAEPGVSGEPGETSGSADATPSTKGIATVPGSPVLPPDLHDPTADTRPADEAGPADEDGPADGDGPAAGARRTGEVRETRASDPAAAAAGGSAEDAEGSTDRTLALPVDEAMTTRPVRTDDVGEHERPR
jgi:dTMP kinase